MAKKILGLAIISLLMLSSMSCAIDQETKAPQAPSIVFSDITGHWHKLSDYKRQKTILILFNNYKIDGDQGPLPQEYFTRYQGINNLEILCVLKGEDWPSEEEICVTGRSQEHSDTFDYILPLLDKDDSVSQVFGAIPNKLIAVLIDRDGYIRFRQEVTLTAEMNPELAQQVEEYTK